VVRAAEKAEIVRRVLAEGGSVRIDGDRIEAAPGPPKAANPTPPSTWTARTRGVAVGGSFVVAVAAGAFVRALTPSSPPRTFHAPAPDPGPVESSPQLALGLPASPSTETAQSPSPATAQPQPRPRSKPAPALQAGEDGSYKAIVAANMAQYSACQRAEAAQDPSAPRRYTLAVTVDANGHAEWVQVVSEASPEMRACVENVTRRLAFPKPPEGSRRFIATLAFEQHA